MLTWKCFPAGTGPNQYLVSCTDLLQFNSCFNHSNSLSIDCPQAASVTFPCKNLDARPVSHPLSTKLNICSPMHPTLTTGNFHKLLSVCFMRCHLCLVFGFILAYRTRTETKHLWGCSGDRKIVRFRQFSAKTLLGVFTTLDNKSFMV